MSLIRYPLFRHMLMLIALCVVALQLQAQSLTAPQLATVCTACKADVACNALRVAQSTTDLTTWLNSARSPATAAWHKAAPSAAIEEAPSYTAYDSLAQGKRDSWLVLLRNPRDFSRQRVRNWVIDVWGNATAGSNAESVLLAATYPATNVQAMLGGPSRTTGTVSALDPAYPYQMPGEAADWLVVRENCQ